MSAMRLIAFVILISLNLGNAAGQVARAADPPPVAPTLQDAHRLFSSLVARNDMAALYTASRDGEILGYLRFPIVRYSGDTCGSTITLTNGAIIDIDWAMANKAQGSDGQMPMWRTSSVTYESFHMMTLEGGVVARPANNFPKLLLTCVDEISRNRLLKAMALLSSTCRSKSKFD